MPQQNRSTLERPLRNMARDVLLCCVLLVGCAGSDAANDGATLFIESVDTLVTTESAAIAHAADLDVASSGTLDVADFMGNSVLAVDSVGETSVLGGEGAGPGELSAPWTVRAVDDGVLVVDRGNGRIQRSRQSLDRPSDGGRGP